MRRSSRQASAPQTKVDVVTSPPAVAAAAKVPTAAYTYIQEKNCVSYKGKAQVEQCQSCIEKQAAAGGCRFVGMRAFKTVPKDASEELALEDEKVGDDTVMLDTGKRKRESSSTNSKFKARKLDMPEHQTVLWDDYCIVGNRSQSAEIAAQVDDACLKQSQQENGYARPAKSASPAPATASTTAIDNQEDVDYVLNCIAPSLEHVLQRELDHEQQTSHASKLHPIARIRNIAGQRSLCDACATSIFVVSYVCIVCGKEYCPDCYDEWDGNGSDARLVRCSRRRKHGKEQLVLLVRADEGEIKLLLDDVQKWRCDHSSPSASIEVDVPAARVPDGPYLPVYKTSVTTLAEPQFRTIWSKGGTPLVLTGFLPRFNKPWTPSYFSATYGSSQCTLHNCAPPHNFTSSTVGEFFDSFGSDSEATRSLKLKDWPPADDFAQVFPDLFTDFEEALPWEGRYMRRDGWMNLASRFPKDWNKPDLGPKMYNAHPAPNIKADTDAQFGTTNLHLDITDAINIMMYAVGEPAERTVTAGVGDEEMALPCSAIWDIFPPSAAGGIRAFLKARNPKLDDPIHRQTYYVSESDLLVLSQEPYNICAYRIFQNPGEAVFIPAGCAHQVRNTRSCIKIAVDFLSPENTKVCEELLQEGRKLSKGGKGGLAIENTGSRGVGEGKREDVLQLWNCLRFTWDTLRKAKITASTNMP